MLRQNCWQFPSNKYLLLEPIALGYNVVIKKAIRDSPDNPEIVAFKMNGPPGCQGLVTKFDFNEVRMLRRLSMEKHVLKLLDVVWNDNQFALVLEYSRVLLSKVMYEQKIPLSVADTKNILLQLFTGLKVLHGRNIMHRNVKPCSFVLSFDGTLKITDFGNSSDIVDHLPMMDAFTCIIWYKSPELCLGSKNYDETVDLWAAGCMAAEFYMRIPALFKGTDNVSQMKKISERCGFCSESVWPEAKLFPGYTKMRAGLGMYRKDKLKDYLLEVTRNEGAANFLGRLLKLNAKQRMSAENAVNDKYFKSDPVPSPDLSQLMKVLNRKGILFQ